MMNVTSDMVEALKNGLTFLNYTANYTLSDANTSAIMIVRNVKLSDLNTPVQIVLVPFPRVVDFGVVGEVSVKYVYSPFLGLLYLLHVVSIGFLIYEGIKWIRGYTSGQNCQKEATK